VYKWLLCWRYLLTRYLALACIISVMLGVATLIVVNSVMAGFSTKLRERLHGLLSDVLIEGIYADGFADPGEMMRRIQHSPVGDKIEAMTPTMEVMAIIQIVHHGQMIARPVRLIGIDPVGRARVGGFAEFLVDARDRRQPSFELSPEAQRWHDEKYPPLPLLQMQPPIRPPPPGEPLPPDPTPKPRSEAPAGAIIGYAIGNLRDPNAPRDAPNKDIPIVNPGDEIILITLSGVKLVPVYKNFVVCDYFKSEMSEYDSNYVFVPLEDLQRLRTMEDRVSSIQIKLKDYRGAPAVVKELSRMFPASSYRVETWEDKQGPLLAAIGVEKRLLNVLLFLIICVAGFGILAIFAMIVAEKTRDIGILKALGASNGGVMKIFVGYALLLGLVGAGFGTAFGLTLTIYINDFEHLLARLTGHDIFPRTVYYFDQIPTDIQGWSVGLVNLGAITIAVLFSIVPAMRAAMLHPVRALRYE
jgi:lipoprotein-releasing system permease protein